VYRKDTILSWSEKEAGYAKSGGEYREGGDSVPDEQPFHHGGRDGKRETAIGRVASRRRKKRDKGQSVKGKGLIKTR